MIVTREEMRKTRLNLVRQMHDYIINMGDEKIYEIWTRDCLPDCPDEEDFEFYTDDPTEFREICEIFSRLILSTISIL